MRINFQSIRKNESSVLAVSVLAVLIPSIAICADFETPPVLKAAETAADLPIETDLYRIEDSVPTDGFMALHSITSPFGTFTASGPGMLDTRLTEIRALAALDAMQDDDRFTEAAQDTAKDTAQNLRRLIERPKETLEGVPEGVGRFFDRTGRALKTGVQKLGDVREGRLPGVDAEATSTLPGGAGSATAPDMGLAESAARASGEAAVNILGYDKQRRRLARELAIDPYTTNHILSDKLDDVTWAAFAGGLGVNVLTSLVPGGLVLSTSSRLSDWVWDTSPGDLRVEIERTLLAMGVDPSEVDRFLRHSYYTMSMQAVLAASLNALDGVNGRIEVMELALGVGSEGQARFMVQTLDMLRTYHQMVAPLNALQVQGTVVGVAQTGQPIVVAPVDHLSWTPQLARFASDLGDTFGTAPQLFVSDAITPRTREELTSLGWVIDESGTLGPFAYPVR